MIIQTTSNGDGSHWMRTISLLKTGKVTQKKNLQNKSLFKMIDLII